MKELTPEEQAQLDAMTDGEPKQDVYTWNEDSQRRVLSVILRDETFLAESQGIIEPFYFENDVHKLLCRILFRYFAKYGSCPHRSTLVQELSDAIKDKDAKVKLYYKGEFSTVYDYYVPGLEERDYLRDITVTFAKEQAIKASFFQSLDVLKRDKDDKFEKVYGLLNDAMTVGEHSDEDGYLIEELIQLPAIEWQVDNHFPLNSFVCVYGPFASGKSFYCLDLGMSIATGQPFLGKHAVKQGSACYIASEGSNGVSKRLKAWMAYYEQDVPPNFMVLARPYNFLEEATAETILRKCRNKLGEVPSVIFIDTLSRSMPGGDENAPKDMTRFIASVDHLIKAGSTVISIHHTGKDLSRGPRGHISLPAACDSIVLLEGEPQGGVLVQCKKQKDAEMFDGYCLEQNIVAVDETDSSLVLTDGGPVVGKKAAAEKKQVAVEEEMLAAIPVSNKAEVEKTCGTTATTRKQLGEKLAWNRKKLAKVIKVVQGHGGVSTMKLDGNPASPEYIWREELLSE